MRIDRNPILNAGSNRIAETSNAYNGVCLQYPTDPKGQSWMDNPEKHEIQDGQTSRKKPKHAIYVGHDYE
jgi:hypothetical protein